MKIKVIDLLKDIAVGKEVPKKIKYNDIIWELEDDEPCKYYANKETGDCLLEYIDSTECLVDEVEIIKPKEIKKIDYANYDLDDVVDTLNQVIEVVKSLDK